MRRTERYDMHCRYALSDHSGDDGRTGFRDFIDEYKDMQKVKALH